MNVRTSILRSTLMGALVLAGACAADSGGAADDARLGPVDGLELPAADLDRVAVGDAAPDFRLASLRRGTLALSDYRGRKDVVLVFYRGHW